MERVFSSKVATIKHMFKAIGCSSTTIVVVGIGFFAWRNGYATVQP
jgi:hypothetical protein